MTIEEELKELRKQYQEEVKRARRYKRDAAIVSGIISTTALMALVFAFFQYTAANRYRILFDKRDDEANQYVLRADKAEQETFTLRAQIRDEIERRLACEKASSALRGNGKTKK